jgi:hypothetical protein
VPDVPPRVELLEPTEDDKATTRRTVALRFHAADDYGLAKAWIAYALADGTEKLFPLEAFTPTPGEKELAWKLRDTLPDLKEGDVLTFAVEVSDKYAGKDGPHRSRSQARRLYIVSVEEYRQHILEKRKRLRAELEALRGQEKEAATEVDTLLQEPDEPPADPKAPDPPEKP